MGKVQVEVVAKFNKEGTIRPISLLWEDGRKFPIDRVLDIRQVVSLKAGLQGMRYTCRIAGKEVYLFCDEGKWFLQN